MPTSSYGRYSGGECGRYWKFYENVASFCSPDVCFQDTRKYIPDLSERRAVDAAIGLTVLEEIGRIVEPVDRSLYEASKISPESASSLGILTIGRYYSISRFGQRTKISLVAASLLGPRTESSCIYVHLELVAPDSLFGASAGF
jgi:hypothetical protein